MNLNNTFHLVEHVENLLLNLDRTSERFTISHTTCELHVIAQSERDQSYSVHSFFWDRDAESVSGSLCWGHYDLTHSEAVEVLRKKSVFLEGAVQ